MWKRAFLLAILASAALLGCSRAGGAEPMSESAPATESPGPIEPPSSESSQAISSPAERFGGDGCAPADLGELKDDGVVLMSQMRSVPPEMFIRSVLPEVAFSDARPESYQAVQPDAPAGKPLSYLAYVSEIETMTFVYSKAEVDAKSTIRGVLGAGGIVAVVSPVGELTADEIYSSTDRNRWMLKIGDHDATLIWGDEVAVGVRPWGLYWNDETRYWIVQGGQDRPEELVDFARAIYCE